MVYCQGMDVEPILFYLQPAPPLQGGLHRFTFEALSGIADEKRDLFSFKNFGFSNPDLCCDFYLLVFNAILCISAVI